MTDRDADRARQYQLLQEALTTGWRLETDPARIAARYKDFDLAETVPRILMYHDIGILVGTVERLVVENGRLRDAVDVLTHMEKPS